MIILCTHENSEKDTNNNIESNNNSINSNINNVISKIKISKPLFCPSKIIAATNKPSTPSSSSKDNKNLLEEYQDSFQYPSDSNDYKVSKTLDGKPLNNNDQIKGEDLDSLEDVEIDDDDDICRSDDADADDENFSYEAEVINLPEASDSLENEINKFIHKVKDQVTFKSALKKSKSRDDGRTSKVTFRSEKDNSGTDIEYVYHYAMDASTDNDFEWYVLWKQKKKKSKKKKKKRKKKIYVLKSHRKSKDADDEDGEDNYNNEPNKDENSDKDDNLDKDDNSDRDGNEDLNDPPYEGNEDVGEEYEDCSQESLTDTDNNDDKELPTQPFSHIFGKTSLNQPSRNFPLNQGGNRIPSSTFYPKMYEFKSFNKFIEKERAKKFQRFLQQLRLNTIKKTLKASNIFNKE
ncbi:protein PFC0760c-like [Gordionus sp. m RMFG-2023]|uniref:protein PFC0760c-like n=1 Tax=Gordionus sp. m RMFG-2023 TaxID=3053472 RepID=UPI0031FBFBDC